MDKVKTTLATKTGLMASLLIFALIGSGTVASALLARPAEASDRPIATTTASSSVPAAGRQFRKGLDLAYRGDLDPAVDAFNEAARLDPECVMCLWGLSWALSSDLEGPVPGERMAEAHSALRRARAVSRPPTHREGALLEALGTRFDTRTEPRGPRRDNAYVERMRRLALEYAGDTDILAAFAFALISTEDVDHWSAEGRLRPAVREALAAAHQALRLDPGHPGALAVYKHTSTHLKASLATR